MFLNYYKFLFDLLNFCQKLFTTNNIYCVVATAFSCSIRQYSFIPAISYMRFECRTLNYFIIQNKFFLQNKTFIYEGK